MTAAQSRVPTYMQPRPKAIATFTTSAQSAATAAGAAGSKPSSAALPATPVRQSSRQISADPLSEKVTTTLIRRTLCSQTADKEKPIADLLPPLTSSNEVDMQLYALIAIIIREFVQTWYSKITPDQVFVEEVVSIIAHCTRGLEQRIRKVDLEALLFDEFPELLDTHVRAYRTAFYPLHPPPLESNPRVIYHSLWPSPALYPVPDDSLPASGLIQKENEAAYRQLLVQGFLAILLPTEDIENDCLTALVGQIFSEMIIGNGLGGKGCEPWLLWEAITKIGEIVQAKLPKSKAQERVDKSGFNEANTKDTGGVGENVRSRPRWSVQKTFWLILQYAFLTFTTIRFVIITIAGSSSLPSRLSPYAKGSGGAPLGQILQPPAFQEQDGLSPSPDPGVPLKRPILAMKLWPCVSNILDLSVRMPWLTATMSMLQWCAIRGPGEVGFTDGMLDKYVSRGLKEPCLLLSFDTVTQPLRIPMSGRISFQSLDYERSQ